MKEQYIVGFLIIIFCMLLTQKIPWILKVCWGYFLILATCRTFWPYYQPLFAPAISNMLAWTGTLSLCLMIVPPLVILRAPEKLKSFLIFAIKIYLFTDAIALICGARGMFAAPTYDATLIACFALFWCPRKWYEALGLFVSAAAIFHVKSRTGVMVLGILYGLTGLQWGYKSLANKKLFWGFVFVIGVVSLAALRLIWGDRSILHDSRMEMWTSWMGWWNSTGEVSKLFGTGIGSFEWLGPALDPGPSQRGLGYGYYLMHNDWLQILFENGYLGLVFALIGYVYVAIKLTGKSFIVWLAVGAAMCFYYPTHSWPIQMLALILISETKLDNPGHSRQPSVELEA